MKEELQLTSVFLSGKGRLRLRKSFLKDGTKQQYPNAKNFTSATRKYNLTKSGFSERLKDLKEFAERGSCLLKGELTKDLVEEERAGKSELHKPNRSLLLDIDNLKYNPDEIAGLKEAMIFDKTAHDQRNTKDKNVPSFVQDSMVGGGRIGMNALRVLAEHFLRSFPEVFQETTYYVHASSSMGTRENVASLHIEFILDKPMSPLEQTKWLKEMNLTVPLFSDKLTLNSTGMGLKWPLDISVSSNAKLIFIAHPYFQAKNDNPIDDNDRIFLVAKDKLLLDSNKAHSSLKTEALMNLQSNAIKRLRREQQLPAKAAKVINLKKMGKDVQLLTNPDSMEFEIVDDAGDFIHANVGTNGEMGDSNAYWWPKNDPTIVYNFKDEPTFRLKDAAPEFYERMLVKYADEIASKKQASYLVRRNAKKGGSFIGIELKSNGKMGEVVEVKDKAAITDWALQFGEFVEENVPYINIMFDPKDDNTYSIEVDKFGVIRERINTYVEAEEFAAAETRTAFAVDPDEFIHVMRSFCPTTLELIQHVIPGDLEEVTHFLNWLIAGVRMKDKIGTTYVLQGTQGTGKGLIWGHVIKPLYGNQNVKKTTITEMEDKFDSNLTTKLMILVDEFQHSEAAASKRLESKLKLMATEKDYSFRAMHKEYTDDVENFFNMIFFSNKRDAMRIDSEEDRRINVAKRQEISLRELKGSGDFYLGLKRIGEMVDKIDAERGLFHSFVKSANYDINMARNVLQNNARKEMAAASRTRMEDFTSAIKRGDLRQFFFAANEMPRTMEEHSRDIRTFLQEFQTSDWGENNEEVFVTVQQMAAFFAYFAEKISTSSIAGKYIVRHVGTDIAKPKRIRRKNTPERGYLIRFPYNEVNIKALEDIQRTFPVSTDNITKLGNAK